MYGTALLHSVHYAIEKSIRIICWFLKVYLGRFVEPLNIKYSDRFSIAYLICNLQAVTQPRGLGFFFVSLPIVL